MEERKQDFTSHFRGHRFHIERRHVPLLSDLRCHSVLARPISLVPRIPICLPVRINAQGISIRCSINLTPVRTLFKLIQLVCGTTPTKNCDDKHHGKVFTSHYVEKFHYPSHFLSGNARDS